MHSRLQPSGTQQMRAIYRGVILEDEAVVTAELLLATDGAWLGKGEIGVGLRAFRCLYTSASGRKQVLLQRSGYISMRAFRPSSSQLKWERRKSVDLHIAQRFFMALLLAVKLE
jgi:hypothetical protein